MRNPIKSSPQFKRYKSNDKIAAKLIEDRPDLFVQPGKDKNVAIRSLGGKIGELDRGEPRWWRTREAQTNCLIELLDLDRDELNLDQKTGRHIFALSAFPICPPVDLMREDGWDIAEPKPLSEDYPQINEPFASADYTKPTLDPWLSPQSKANPIKKIEYLYMPDVTEYQLLTRKLEVRGHRQFESYNSLRNVIDNDKELLCDSAPLILAIREKPEAFDLLRLNDVCQEKPLLVISLTPPPPLPDLEPEKENETDEARKQREQINDRIKRIKRDFNNWVWTLKPDWHAKLCTWLEERINTSEQLVNKTNFSSGGTQKLLQKLDPNGKLIGSVDDALALCQAVHEKGEIVLIKGIAGGKGNVDELLLQLFNLENLSPSTLILLKQLIEWRWKRWDLAWEGELDKKIWSDILDKKDLNKIDDILTISRGPGMGGFEFRHPILIRLLLRNQLILALSKVGLTAWAPACFDNQRRPLVDAVLDAVNIDQLKQIAAQMINEPTSAETIGAGEALFAAIGRRIIREEDIGGELTKLANHVLTQLTWGDGILWPYSRPLTSTAQQFEWICVCWAWSLMPSPGTNLPPNWLFPGWNPELSKDVPKWLNSIASNFFSQDMTIPMRDFLSVVTRWLARHETLPTYENMPPLFKAGLLARAAAGQWSASPDWWEILLTHPTAEQTLLNQVKSANPSVNLRTALIWWPSLVKFQRNKNGEKLRYGRHFGSSLFTRDSKEQGYSALLNWVMQQMEIHDKPVLTGLDDEDRKFLILHPAALPTSVKRQLLGSLATDFPTNWHPVSFLNFFLDYGPETADEMEMFLDNDELGDQAARCLWKWKSSTAESLLKENRGSREALRRLILAIPSSSAIGDAVTLLKDNPALLSDKERHDWVRWRLPDARQYAQDLLQLLNAKTEG